MDPTLLKRRLARAVENEKRAMYKLRLAQTLYDKRYASRLRLQEKVFEMEKQVQAVIDRMENSK